MQSRYNPPLQFGIREVHQVRKPSHYSLRRETDQILHRRYYQRSFLAAR
jgi:hypothetical protein